MDGEVTFWASQYQGQTHKSERLHEGLSSVLKKRILKEIVKIQERKSEGNLK